MRSFIAIDLPPDIKSSIDRLINVLSADSRGIRWVPAENIHLTLKFLGDVREDLVPEIVDRLTRIVKNYQTFGISIRGAGAFPNLRNPNVLWVGIESSDRLEALFTEIDLSLSEIGFEREGRKFSPHLTIGRVKDRRGIDPVAKELATYKDAIFGTIEVHEILLMKSVLKPSGAEYSRAAVIKFRV